MPVAAIAGGSAIWSGYQAHKAGKRADKQLAGAEEQRGLLNETARAQRAASQPFFTGGAKTFDAGQRTFNQGMQQAQGRGALNPDFEQAAGYYRNILSGDRAAASGALAPDVAAITENYRGAESNARAHLRGGQRDLALSELNRDRVGKTAGLRATLRPGAAASLSDIGKFRVGAGQANAGLGLQQSGLGLGQSQLGASLLNASGATQGTVFGGQQNLYNIANQNAQQAGAYANQAGSAFGNILIDILRNRAKTGGTTGGGGASGSF